MFSYNVGTDQKGFYWILAWNLSGCGISSYAAQGYTRPRMWWQREGILHNCWKQRYSPVSPVVSFAATWTKVSQHFLSSWGCCFPYFYLDHSVLGVNTCCSNHSLYVASCLLLLPSPPLPSRWATSSLQGYPQHEICWHPFIHLGGERYCESQVSFPGTQPSDIQPCL